MVFAKKAAEALNISRSKGELKLFKYKEGILILDRPINTNCPWSINSKPYSKGQDLAARAKYRYKSQLAQLATIEARTELTQH